MDRSVDRSVDRQEPSRLLPMISDDSQTTETHSAADSQEDGQPEAGGAAGVGSGREATAVRPPSTPVPVAVQVVGVFPGTYWNDDGVTCTMCGTTREITDHIRGIALRGYIANIRSVNTYQAVDGGDNMIVMSVRWQRLSAEFQYSS